MASPSENGTAGRAAGCVSPIPVLSCVMKTLFGRHFERKSSGPIDHFLATTRAHKHYSSLVKTQVPFQHLACLGMDSLGRIGSRAILSILLSPMTKITSMAGIVHAVLYKRSKNLNVEACTWVLRCKLQFSGRLPLQ